MPNYREFTWSLLILDVRQCPLGKFLSNQIIRWFTLCEKSKKTCWKLYYLKFTYLQPNSGNFLSPRPKLATFKSHSTKHSYLSLTLNFTYSHPFQDSSAFRFLLTAIALCSVQVVLIVSFLTWRTFRAMDQLRDKMHPKTRALHRQINILLIVQTSIIFIITLLPQFVYSLALLFRVAGPVSTRGFGRYTFFRLSALWTAFCWLSISV
jgi:hypothetical protein